MKLLWEALWEKLSNDATLISMTGYTTSTKTIKRGNSIGTITFSGTITRAVTFQEWTDVRNAKADTDDMRDITFMLSCWSKKSDLASIELSDYLMTLLDGVDLTNSDIKNYYSEYDDFLTPPYYDDKEQAWRVDSRFRFKVALL